MIAHHGIPLMNIVHSNNHTQTKKVCTINSKLQYENLTADNLPVEFSDLSPGIYCITINSKEYFFDLFMYIGPNDKEKLIIKNENNAYILLRDAQYTINLYEKVSSVTKNKTELNNTVNNYMDMIVINGKTIQYPYKPNDITDRLAVIPNNGDIPSSDLQLIESKSLSELEEYNTIFRNLDYVKFGSYNIEVEEDEYDTSDKSLDNPYSIKSISKFYINTKPDNIESYTELEVYLKNNIKSLPNGIKDTFILNSLQCQNHIIYRIGRGIITGGEECKFLETLSNNKTWLFWIPNAFIKSENADKNIVCSHFNTDSYTNIIKTNNTKASVSSGYGTYKNGILIRIPILENTNNINATPIIVFKNWLRSQVYNGTPVIIEYTLDEPIYKTVLLDEYHINTYFNKTNILLNNNYYDASYFYKKI